MACGVSAGNELGAEKCKVCVADVVLGVMCLIIPNWQVSSVRQRAQL
jgi:hypothetical protein